MIDNAASQKVIAELASIALRLLEDIEWPQGLVSLSAGDLRRIRNRIEYYRTIGQAEAIFTRGQDQI